MLDRLPARRTDIALRRNRSRPVRALLAAGTAVVLAGCAGPPRTDTSDTAADTTTDLFAAVGHVHGVGVDPADGSTVIAGHHGLFGLAPTAHRPLARHHRRTVGRT